MNPLDPTEARPHQAAHRAGSSDDTTALPAETPRPNVDTTVAHAAAAPLAAAYREGDWIGRYQVRRLLGEGAFGRVYACWDEKLAREVAVKVPKRRLAGDQQLAAFLREAQAAGKLRHPGIVQVFDVGQQATGEPFVVMEVVAGESLADVAKRGAHSHQQIARLLAQTADALAHAHQNNLVHRDVKPSNIWIDTSGSVRLLDFGLALDDERRWHHAGELAGTYQFMAPEQVSRQAHRLDGRADIWSLGVIMYELLAGRRPYSGNSISEICDEIQHKEPRPPRQVRPGAPPELERICLKCLQKKPADRYATAGDLAADLRRFAVGGKPSRRPVAMALAAGVIILAGGLGLLNSRLFDPRPPLTPHIDDGKHGQAVVAPAVEWGVNVFLNGDLEKSIAVNKQPVALVNGDAVQIWATLSRPGYLAVAWIDGAGKVSVLTPLSDSENLPVTTFRQPPGESQGFPIEPPIGVDTAVLIVSPTKLPLADELAAALAPSAPFPKLGDVVLLDGKDVQPQRPNLDSETGQLLVRAGRRGINTTAKDLAASESLGELTSWRQTVASKLPVGAEVHYLAMPHQ
jgi:hypothetical protein